MGTPPNKLSSLTVQRYTKPGRYCDGNGLYLEVSKRETKAWIFRYMINGRARVMGLGPYPVIGLADARLKALECKRMVVERKDPLEERRQRRKEIALEQAKSIAFDECAAAYIEAHRAGWKNAKHAEQWKNTIATYASPTIGRLPVQSIDTALVMRVLEPIWKEKTETASRLRNRIELILGWATAREYRAGENPARWRGHLDKLLPKRSTVQPTQHHPAMPIDEIGAFMKRLRNNKGVAYSALEFLILTATRTDETLGALWSEVDFDNAIWTIPASRMKSKREHRVPLSAAALAVLRAQREVNTTEFVFTTWTGNRPSANALLAVLKRMEAGVTSHGFRSTFRDWSSERTNYSREVAEMALAHAIESKVEAAYRRGDLFEKRKRLMAAWAEFCSRDIGDSKRVVSFRPHSQAAVGA